MRDVTTLAPPAREAPKSFWQEYKPDMKWAVSLLLLTILGLSGWLNPAWQAEPEKRENIAALTTGSLLADFPVPIVNDTTPVYDRNAASVVLTGRAFALVDGEAMTDNASIATVRQGGPFFLVDGRLARVPEAAPLQAAGTIPSDGWITDQPEWTALVAAGKAPPGTAKAVQASIVTANQVHFEQPLVFPLQLLGVLLVAALVGALALAFKERPGDAESGEVR